MLKIVQNYVRQVLYLMVGMPDYQQYCEYMRQHRPQCKLVDYKTFYRDRVEARYNSKNNSRCC